MKNNDALKKHHFWILFGLVPLFVLIAIFAISSSVGGEVTKRNTDIESTKKDLASKSNPKGKGVLELWEKQIGEVKGKQDGLWLKNWDLQARSKRIYAWPKSSRFTNFVGKTKVDGKDVDKAVKLEDLRFGANIPDNDNQYLEFLRAEFYKTQFSTVGISKLDDLGPGFKGMADRIAPTQFLGGWERILRHVNDWGTKALTSEQIWLIMEDIWVQRSLLESIELVNEYMAAFERVKYEDKAKKVIDDPKSPTGPNDPLRRKFRSRIWEVTIEVANKGNKRYFTGTLANITERLQVLGKGKTMTLKVWLEGNYDENNKLKLLPDGTADVTGI